MAEFDGKLMTWKVPQVSPERFDEGLQKSLGAILERDFDRNRNRLFESILEFYVRLPSVYMV